MSQPDQIHATLEKLRYPTTASRPVLTILSYIFYLSSIDLIIVFCCRSNSVLNIKYLTRFESALFKARKYQSRYRLFHIIAHSQLISDYFIDQLKIDNG